MTDVKTLLTSAVTPDILNRRYIKESLQNEQAEQQVGIAGLATKRERHPKGCSFSLVHITICIVTQITYIFESGEFTELVRHGCGQKLFIVTRVTVTSTRVILLSLPSPML